MKAYMAYSHIAGSSEAAVLVFANTAREAKKLAWGSIVCDFCDNDWTDLRVNQLKDMSWLFKEMRRNIPHVIDNPRSCDSCGFWGNSEIGDDGLCEGCREED